MLLPLPTTQIIAAPFHQTEQDRRRLHQKLRSLKVKTEGEKRGRNNNKKYYLCSQERVGSQFVAICDRL